MQVADDVSEYQISIKILRSLFQKEIKIEYSS